MPARALCRISTAVGRIGRLAAALERVLCAALIVVFTAVLLTNVISRYVFDAPLFFAEELALLMLVWMGYLGIAYSIHKNEQIGMGLVVDGLSPQRKRLVLILVDVIMIVASGILLWAALQWLRSSSVFFERAVTLAIPKWPFYLAIPFFWSLVLIHLVDHVLARLVAVFAEEA